MKNSINLDNNATTQLDPNVLTAVLEELTQHYGNPSSAHTLGQESKSRLSKARQTIASYLNVRPSEIVFTSGGTESLNMIIQGIKGPIITSTVEHSAVYATVKYMESIGSPVTYLTPGLWGAITPEALKDVIHPNTALIALMAVNNETGVKSDIESIASIAAEAGVPLLVDGVALLGKETFTLPAGVSAMAFSGHKLHAPKGIGFAFIRSTFRPRPLLYGGEQEQGRRGGTENIAGIIGLAEAVKILSKELPEGTLKMTSLRDKLESALISSLPHVTINGQGPRICNTTNLSFGGIEGETLLAALDLENIAVSHGSACSSGALEPSRILLNMGISRENARASIRFSLSRFTTEQEIDYCIATVIRLVTKLRKH